MTDCAIDTNRACRMRNDRIAPGTKHVPARSRPVAGWGMPPDISLLSGHSSACAMGVGYRFPDWVSFRGLWHPKRHPMMAASPYIPPPGIYAGTCVVTPLLPQGHMSLRSSGGASETWHIPLEWVDCAIDRLGRWAWSRGYGAGGGGGTGTFRIILDGRFSGGIAG